MKFELVRKMVTYLLFIVLLTNLFCMPTYAEEEKKYALAQFGTKIITENMTITNNGMTPVYKEGREGLSTISSSWKMELWMDLDEDFMSNLPLNTPVAVTVDYFDGNGKFCVVYDSYNPLYYTEFVNVGAWQQTETIYMENTQQWKSHTFILNDFRANDSAQSGMLSDLRITAVDPISRLYPKEDVVFGSVRVEYVEDEDIVPVKFERASSKYYGNIFSADETVELNLECLNITDEDVTLKTKYRVYNIDTNKVVADGEIESNFVPNEEKDVLLKITNPGIYGIYNVDFDFEYIRELQSESRVSAKDKTEFSVANVFDDGTVNNLMGSMEHFVNFYTENHYGDNEPIAETQNRAGMGMTRGEFSRALSYSDGKYKIDDGALERLRAFTEDFNGDVLIVLNQDMSKYAHGDMPDNPERYAEYAQMCADIVEQCKGMTNYFELWNEPNITFGNKDLDPPECYVEMCKVAYPAIKKVNPDAVVLIGSTAASASGQTTLDIDWHEKVFEAGIAEYMDGVSYHPYEWSSGFRERRFIQGFTDLKNIMEKYKVGDKEIWVTEFGFSSNFDGKDDVVHQFTETEQYQMTVLSYHLVKALDLADVFTYYKYCDGWGRSHGNRWGWVRTPEYHKTFDHVEYAAKKVYLAMTAVNQFMGVDTEIRDFIQEVGGKSSAYVTYGYNSKRQKDIVMLQTTNYDATMNFELGCRSVDMYDAYGNKIDTIYSDNEIFTFTFGKDPIYVEGNFAKFAKTEKRGSVMTDAIAKDAAGGDTVIFNFTKKTDTALAISVEGVEIAKNDGFINDTALLKLNVPNDKDFINCHIRITDNKGNIYYSAKHSVNIKETLVMSFVTEQVLERNTDRWRVRATVKNIANEKSLNGNIRITAPDIASSLNSTRKIIDLEPGKEAVYFFNLPKRINKSVLDLEIEATINDGKKIITNEQVCFSTAVYAENKPIIDGKVNIGEWNGSWIGANEKKDYVQLISPWRGEDDLSFSGTMLWDEGYFYFLAIVTDDIYYVNHQPSGITYTWKGDGIQFGIDDRVDINSVETAVLNEISIGEVPGIGPVVYKQKAFYANSPVGVVLENAEIGFNRYEDYAVYECKIPWEDIYYPGYVVNPDNKMRFSVLANDNDGAERKGFIQYTGGIGTVKNVMDFGTLTLLR